MTDNDLHDAITALREIAGLRPSDPPKGVVRTMDGDVYPGLLGHAQGIAQAALDGIDARSGGRGRLVAVPDGD